jgi:Cytidylate kinase-like family
MGWSERGTDHALAQRIASLLLEVRCRGARRGSLMMIGVPFQIRPQLKVSALKLGVDVLGPPRSRTRGWYPSEFVTPPHGTYKIKWRLRLARGTGMAIIAVSEQLGSRGVDLGRLAAELLGYRFLSHEQLIAQVSRTYSVTPDQLLVVDLREPHFWTRLKTEGVRLVSFLRATLLREMAADRLVVVGRSPAVYLPPYGCGIKVRTVGPFQERAKLVGGTENLTPVAAQRRVRDHDREVRARVQMLTGIDIEDPASYDVVVNGYGALLEFSAAALATYAERIDRQVRPEQWQRMRDLATAAQVRAACHAHPKLGRAPIEVECSAGVVQMRGPGLVPPWDELANQVASGVEGVHSVEVKAEETPILVRLN